MSGQRMTEQQGTGAENRDGHPLEALLGRWMALASLQQRVLAILCGEVNRTSAEVEREALTLSSRFREVAEMVFRQSENARELSALAMGAEDAGLSARDAAALAAGVRENISGIVMGLQFQDRAKQRLEHVADTLAVLGDALQDLHRDSAAMFPGQKEGDRRTEIEWLETILARYTLGEMRHHFVTRLLEGGYEADETPAEHVDAEAMASEGGSIELF